MKCPKCGKDVELTKKQIGLDDNNQPIFNEYAICRDCKKQWNLDKQREKKAAANSEKEVSAPKKSASGQEPQKREAAKKPAERKVSSDNASPEKKIRRNAEKTDSTGDKSVGATEVSAKTYAGSTAKATPKKKRPAPARPETQEEQRYANIPPEKVRVKREKAVKQNYEDMLASDPERKPVRKKRPANPEHTAPKRNTVNEAPVRKKTAPKKKAAPQRIVEEPKPKFKILRIVFGVISILAFGFFAYKGFLAGLNNISAGKNAATGTVYIVLALCMLVSGLLLLIMQKKKTIFAFILPMLFYFGSSSFAFFKRGGDNWLLYGSILAAALALIFLALALASRSGDEEDYEDPFEDDYE